MTIPCVPTIKDKPEAPPMKRPKDDIRIDVVLAKELENERARSERLEFENFNLRAKIEAFDEHDTYPPNINACIRDVKNYLNQLYERKS